MDKERIGLARKELVSMLGEEELKNTILLVFANKQDIQGALKPAEIAKVIKLWFLHMH